jgi:hypothetical protein
MILTPLLVTGSVYSPVTNATFWVFVGVGLWVVKLEAATLPAVVASVLSRTVPVDHRRGSIVGEGVR